MKARLNITIEERLLESFKSYAAKRQTSVSELVETYFKTVTKPSMSKNILQLVEKMPETKIKLGTDPIDTFYQENAKKYGF